MARDGGRIVGWVLAKALTDPPPVLHEYRGRGGIGALVVHPDCQRQGIGRELLARAEAFLAASGVATSGVYYPHHFVPGIPAECESAMVFFRKHGYEGFHECVDLIRDLNGWAPPANAFARRSESPTVTIRPLVDGEQSALIEFVRCEFSAGWAYSTHCSVEHGEIADFVVAVEHSEIIGFCHTWTWQSALLGGSTHWHPLLDEQWGGLGPIGLGAAHRKRGLGLALLCESVLHNQRRGVQRMAIDWTTLVDFYCGIGFRVWKRYRMATKILRN